MLPKYLRWYWRRGRRCQAPDSHNGNILGRRQCLRGWFLVSIVARPRGSHFNRRLSGWFLCSHRIEGQLARGLESQMLDCCLPLAVTDTNGAERLHIVPMNCEHSRRCGTPVQHRSPHLKLHIHAGAVEPLSGDLGLVGATWIAPWVLAFNCIRLWHVDLDD